MSESPHRKWRDFKAEESLSAGLRSLDPRRFRGKSQRAHNVNANIVRAQALLAAGFPGFFPWRVSNGRPSLVEHVCSTSKVERCLIHVPLPDNVYGRALSGRRLDCPRAADEVHPLLHAYQAKVALGSQPVESVRHGEASPVIVQHEGQGDPPKPAGG